MDDDRPALRPLEVHEIDDGARRGLVLVDPLGLAPGPVFVPAGLLPVVGRLDGTRTIPTIEAEVAHELGAALPEGLVADLVRQFDESLLLDGELFATTLERTADDFARRDVRTAAHAGSAGYPVDPESCSAAIDALLGRAPTAAPRRAPAGLIAPHIDLARGAVGYAAAYRELRRREPAALYVVLGTGHAGPDAPVVGLGADWETPAGRLRTDRDFVDAVHARIGRPSRRDLWLHAHEHSVEFQMLFLARLLRDSADARVAGFLCGALPSATGDPDAEAWVAELVAAFADAAHGRRVCFVAAADLAHVGPFFGDREPLDDARLAALGRADRARLAHLERGAPGAFHGAVVARGNPDRVCSATALYLTARLAAAPARLLHYGQAVADDRAQCVTFCSAVFD